ncbi:MAG: heme-binding protein [Pseudomonadota bacterium]
MLSHQSLDQSEALQLAQFAQDLSHATGVAQNIAVVDHSGALLVFIRMDGAKLIAGPIAINKAFTAATAQARTADIAPKTLPGEPGFMIQLQQNGRFTTLGGGVPLLMEDAVVGGLGISGGSVAQDIEIADAAAKKLELA